MFIDTNTKTIFSTHSEIRNFFSGVSLPDNISDSDLASIGVKAITINMPLYNHTTQTIEAQDVQEVDGEYFIDYSINDKTAEEIEAERKASVPSQITKLQAMKQMKVIGKWETFKAFLAADEDINDEWLLSDNLNRTYPLVLGVGQLFEYDADELDTFFIEASKL